MSSASSSRHGHGHRRSGAPPSPPVSFSAVKSKPSAHKPVDTSPSQRIMQPAPPGGKRAPPAAASGGEVRGIRHGGKCLTRTGAVVNFAKMTPQEIAGNIELLELLTRPLQCGPMAPINWVSTRSYPRAIELRDEMRMDEDGLTIGDRTFKRLYQSCEIGIQRYNALTAEEKKTVDAAGWKGHRFTPDDPLFLGPIRTPTYTVEHAFRFVMDKYWHRYLLPFGCFAVQKPTMTGAGWDAWKRHQLGDSRNTGNLMNPCSVTAADVLYLVNTTGYLDRLIYIVGIILWAKKDAGVNLLRHVSAPPRDSATEQFDRYMTMEKHIHLFGCLYMHRKVIESNQMITNNWKDTIELLSLFLVECYSRFGLTRDCLNHDLDNMIVEAPKTSSLVNLQAFFPGATRIGADAKK